MGPRDIKLLTGDLDGDRLLVGEKSSIEESSLDL
jgi:hypothetical protein